jgi:DNA-damage-inducible protein J
MIKYRCEKEVIEMAQTLINFRIDEITKQQMEQICSELGITMSTAFNIFAKKMCREKRIPFDVSIDPFYSENNMKAIYKSMKQLDEGKVITKTLDELEAMEDE